MATGYGQGREIDRRLERLANSLADTGKKLKNGSFSLAIPPGKKEGCTDGRPSFATRPPPVDGEPSPSFTIVTPHAGEACAFVDFIYKLFRPLLDECIEQDFFDRLTQASVDYSCYVEPADATAANLMKVILAEAEAIADDMQSGQFPYTQKLP